MSYAGRESPFNPPSGKPCKTKNIQREYNHSRWIEQVTYYSANTGGCRICTERIDDTDNIFCHTWKQGCDELFVTQFLSSERNFDKNR